VGIAEAGVLANAVPRAIVTAMNLRVMGDTPFPVMENKRGKAVKVPIGLRKFFQR
jgi:hypothetical protein